MDPVHWHLVLTHVPVVGSAFAVLLLGVAWVSRQPLIGRLGLAGVVLVAALTVPAFLTGEPAEEVAERLPGVTEEVIDRHEDASKTALLAVGLAGVLGLAGFLTSFRARGAPAWVVLAVLLVTAASAGLLGWTANLGGQIRHPEIRGPQARAAPDEAARAEDRRGRRGPGGGTHED
jgi:hypothetical protein